MKILPRLTAVCAVAVLVGGGYLRTNARFSERSDPGKFRNAGLAMEFARTAEQAREIMPLESDRVQMASQQRMDFLFIGTYWLLFVFMGLLIMRRTLPGALPLAVAMFFCATLAAWFDVREDLAILNVVSAAENVGDDMVVLISHYSGIKWTALFLAMLILSVVFIPRKDWGTLAGKLSTLAGLCFVASGLIGLVNEYFIPISMSIMFVGALLVIGMFLFAANAFLSSGNFRNVIP
jgi:hypothetical protein